MQVMYQEYPEYQETGFESVSPRLIIGGTPVAINHSSAFYVKSGVGYDRRSS